MDIILYPDGNRVTVIHRLLNKGMWPVELAPWALTVMEQRGKVIIPQPPYKSHHEELLPLRAMAV